jgi:hypothetical protein
VPELGPVLGVVTEHHHCAGLVGQLVEPSQRAIRTAPVSASSISNDMWPAA